MQRKRKFTMGYTDLEEAAFKDAMDDHYEVTTMAGKAEQNPETSFEGVFRTVAALSRSDANRWLSDNLDKLPGEFWDKYRNARKRELLHIHHVRLVMGKINQNGGSTHDFSKDEWYFLVTIGKFTMGYSDMVDAAFKEALDDHYRWEPHHPEHEKVAGKECTADDIIEMAVDRLSRNLQFNNAQYNREQMEMFAPVFPVARDWKLKTYWEAVEQHGELAKKLWMEMMQQN